MTDWGLVGVGLHRPVIGEVLDAQDRMDAQFVSAVEFALQALEQEGPREVIARYLNANRQETTR